MCYLRALGPGAQPRISENSMATLNIKRRVSVVCEHVALFSLLPVSGGGPGTPTSGFLISHAPWRETAPSTNDGPKVCTFVSDWDRLCSLFMCRECMKTRHYRRFRLPSTAVLGLRFKSHSLFKYASIHAIGYATAAATSSSSDSTLSRLFLTDFLARASVRPPSVVPAGNS